MADDLHIYLQPTIFLDSGHQIVCSLALRLTAECNNDADRAKALFYYVRDQIHYNMYDFTINPDSYIASNILTIGHGWCAQKALALAALGRACTIPSRLIVSTIRNHKIPAEARDVMGTDIFFPHIFNQFYINRKWVKCAATFDRDICERQGVPVVEFDGTRDATLSRRDLNGEDYIEYLEEYGHFDDLPWDWIWQQYPRVYGKLNIDSMLRLMNMKK